MSGLNRALGMPMLTFYGMGMILGAGIYSVIGKAAVHTGKTLGGGFIFASVVAFLTAFAYAELGTMFPKSGAEFTYLSHAYKKHKWLAETIGIAMAFSGAATAATVALAFAGYLNQFVHVPSIFTAICIIVIFSGLAMFGIRESGWANIIFTLIEISGLVMVIYLGINHENFGKALSAMPNAGTLSGAALIIFSFFGFENIVNLAEEAKNPAKNLPRAIFVSLGVSSILYVLVSLAALALMRHEQMGESEAALMSVLKGTSERAAKILGGIALFSTANTALIAMIGASRILYGMAEEKSLPQSVAKVFTKRKTPWMASVIIMVSALAFVPLGKVETVASISALATIIAFFAVNVTLIYLRFSQPDLPRPFRTPLQIKGLPVIPLVAAICCAIFLFQFNGTVYTVGGIFLLLCAVIFFYKNHKK
jgi:basic amino acid/polyamine antiporter, APA family